MTFAVLCPGQGHQHPRMLDFAADDSRARAVLDDATTALGADPRGWLQMPATLSDNAIAQPLICVAQLAQWRALADALPQPDIIAGYSVGELASYACADALDTEALARLARARATAMNDANVLHPGALASIRGLRGATVDALCAGRDAWVAIAVGAASFVIGGTEDAIDATVTDAREHGADAARLPVGVAAHTPLLAPAVEPFRRSLWQARLRECAVPVVSGVTTALVRQPDDAVDALSRQLAHAIDWAGVQDVLVERGFRVFLELGPGSALSRAIRSRHPHVEARACEDFRSLDGVIEWARARLA